MSSPWIRCFIAILLASGIAGCDLLPEVKEETAGWSAEKLYQEAHTMLVTGNYNRAIKLYDTLEGRFPYGRYRATGDPRGRLRELPDWRDSDGGCRLRPVHPHLPQPSERRLRVLPEGRGQLPRGPGHARLRRRAGLVGARPEDDAGSRSTHSSELVTRFPESKYAADSAQRMRYLVNALSAYEVHVADYYYRRGAYVAAVNRAQASLINYPQTPANEDGADDARSLVRQARPAAVA